MMNYKWCQHGDLVTVTYSSLCKAASIDSLHMVGGTIEPVSFICNRILCSKLLEAMAGRR
jgi:hypothetical protein